MKSRTDDVPTRYCNQCGQEEHGTAGCHTSRPILVGADLCGAFIRPREKYRVMAGVLYHCVDDIPPGAKPFRLPKRAG